MKERQEFSRVSADNGATGEEPGGIPVVEKRTDGIRRRIALCTLLLVPLLIDPFTLYPAKSSKFLLIQLIVFVLVILEAFPRSRRRNRRFDLVWLPILGIGALFLYHVVADPYLPDAYGSDPSIGPMIHHWMAFKQALQYGSFLIWAAMIILGRFGDDFPRRLIRIVLLASFPIAAYLILQAYDLDVLKWYGMGDDPRRKLLSTLGNPLYVADYLAMTLLLRVFSILDSGTSVWAVLRRRKAGTCGAGWGIFSLLAFPVEIYALLLTSSRGAIVVAVVATALLIFPDFLKAVRRYRIWAFAVTAAVVVFLTFAFPLLTEHVSPVRTSYHQLKERVLSAVSGDDFSALSRLVLWDICLLQWKDAPFLGIGMDQFRVRFIPELTRYFDRNELAANIFRGSPQLMANEAHNEYFQVLTEWGIVGLLLLLFLIIVSLYRAFLLARSNDSGVDAREKRMIWAFFCVVTAFSIEIFYGFEIRLPAQTLLFFSVVGSIHYLWIKATRLGEDAGSTMRRSPKRIYGLLFVLFGVLGLTVTGATYAGEVLGRAGKVCLSVGRPGLALKRLEYALALSPDRGEFWHYYALAVWQTERDPKEALRLTNVGIRMATDPMAYVMRGQILIEMKRYQEADRQLSEFSRFRIPLDGLHHALGLLHYYRKEYPEAVIEFKEEVKSSGRRSLSQIFLGLSYQALKDYRSAETALKEAVDAGPNSFEAQYRYGILLAEMGRYEEAYEYVLRAMQLAEEGGDKNSYAEALSIARRLRKDRLPAGRPGS